MSEELALLTQLLCEDALDPEGRRRLAAILAEDRAQRARVLAELRTDVRLRSLLAGGDGAETARRIDLILDRRSTSQRISLSRAVQRRIEQRAARGRSQPRRRPWPIAVALAAAVLLGIGLWWAPASRAAGQPGPIVAQISAAEGAVVVRAGASLNAEPELALRLGDELRVSAGGSAALRYADGSAVALGPDSVLALSGAAPKRLELGRGSLEASIAPQREGPLAIRTPHATATVIGTRFALQVDRDATQLDVHSGSVGFGAAQGPSELLSAGASARMAAAPGAGPASRLRALSWNLAGADVAAVPAQMRLIAGLGPDLVALQGLAAGSEQRCETELEGASGADWHASWAPAAGGGALILSRYALDERESAELSVGARRGTRSAARARLRAHGRELQVFATRFGWTRDSFAAETEDLQRLLAWTARFPAPQLLLADLGAQHGSVWIALSRERYRDPVEELGGDPSGPQTRSTGGRSQFVLHAPGASASPRPIAYRALPSELAEHRPLVVDFLLAGDPGQP